MKIIIPGSKSDERIDKFLSDSLKGEYKDTKFQFLLSREFVKNNVINDVTVGSKGVKPSYRLSENEEIFLDKEKLGMLLEKHYDLAQRSDRIDPEEGEISIVDETGDYIIINKPHNLVVHPGIGHSTGTLANYVKGYLQANNEYDPLVKRAGIVHRLDKSVGGLIVFAKSRKFQLEIQEQFEKHQILKLYKAKVEEVPEKLGSKETISDEKIQLHVKNWKNGEEKYDTNWIEIKGFICRDANNRKRMEFNPYIIKKNSKDVLMYVSKKDKDDILIRIVTGRMHQIRATLSYFNSTVIGDTLYKDGTVFPEKIDLKSVIIGFNNKNERVVYAL